MTRTARLLWAGLWVALAGTLLALCGLAILIGGEALGHLLVVVGVALKWGGIALLGALVVGYCLWWAGTVLRRGLRALVPTRTRRATPPPQRHAPPQRVQLDYDTATIEDYRR